ncbi:ABC-2 type transport system permease protein [Algoriphagus boseongensis]|uniref:ABC-2 type transport system permease protein n=1 Tax=Algoriphagus boseongensis TaxID=1442587 RepID=A0A4R6T6E0_9BACT|nr:ABC transporter permease [Algoriphagus boseongensis]TDQ17609.1 ABC-2 type transport system permease protein [Algoriphagus boseongensis]
MHKILLVIQREYLARVKKKSFLIATLLTPLIFPAIMGIFVWIAVQEKENQSLRIIEVIDETNLFFMESSEQYAFTSSIKDAEEAKKMVQEGERYGFLYIPKMDLTNPKGIQFYSIDNPNMNLMGYLEGALKRKIEDQRLYEKGIDPQVLKDIRTSIDIQSVTLGDEGEEKVNDATVNYALGFVSGILIYLFIFIYGNQIMQGVIEEKSSRIVEILVSSLRPFQLMMGKIVGIGAVGLTQFLIWVFLIGSLSSIVIGVLGMQMPQQQAMEMANPEFAQAAPDAGELSRILMVIDGIDFFALVTSFIFYFLGGYLLYGSLFAAIGSAVDAPSDAQQFMFPITIPLIVSYMGLFVFVLQDPNSTTSFWLSVIPLTSPIAMMGRISYGVPFWELALSMGLLIAGFLFTTWLAGKIYRIGILMHGTKPTYKILWKWVKASQ